MKNIGSLLLLTITLFISSCTSSDDSSNPAQVFVLTPVAGSDQIIEVDETVNLTGEETGNSTSFTIEWSFTETPNGSSVTLANASSLTPSFVPDVAGTYVLSMKTSVGDQNSQDSVVIEAVDDIETVQASILFVNAIDGSSDLLVSVDGENINASGLDAFEYSSAYEKTLARNDIEFTFTLGGNSFSETFDLVALGNYTMVVTGTTSAPEVIFHENIWNERTIDATTADDGVRKNDAMYVIHAASGLDEITFHTELPGQGMFTLDFIIKFRNVDEEIGALVYKETATALIGHTNTASISDTWAQFTSDGDTSDKDNAVTDIFTGTAFGDGLDSAGWFVTYVTVKDASADTGYRIIYINNTAL